MAAQTRQAASGTKTRSAPKPAEVVLPTRNLAGKAKSARPGSDLKRGDAITNNLNAYVEKAVREIRNRSDVNAVIRALMREDGLFSSAANGMIALASHSGFKLAGYDVTGSMSLEVMSAAYSIIDRVGSLHDYSQGFNDKPGIQNLLATLQTDVIGTGGCGLEMVLDKEFVAERMIPIGYSTITWESDGKGGRYPTQDSGDINLNIPTVFVAEHNRSADEAYSVSLLRPGLAQTVHFSEFLEDTHRAVNRTGHSRLIATLVSEKVWASAPDDVKADPAKRTQFFNDVRQQVEEALEGLEPEDALVAYDSVTYAVEDTGGNNADYAALLSTLGNLLGASLKTPASVSGLRAGGGQGLSNAETLIYLKVVQATRPPVEEVMSRALTLAVRLMGVDGSVQFEYLPVNLRPEDELEAYKGTKQNRILEMLSHGLINDADACYQLGVRPQGMFTQLQGTGFYSKSAAQPAADRTTSSGAALAPDTPTKSGGKDQ
jgi:hypothetical protein